MASLVHAGEPMPHGGGSGAPHPAGVATSTVAPAENTAHATAAAKAPLAPHATEAAAPDVGVFLDTYPANGPCEDTMLINHEDSVYCVFDGHGGPQCSTYLQEHFPHAFARVLHRHRDRVGLKPQPLEAVDTPPTQPTSPTDEPTTTTTTTTTATTHTTHTTHTTTTTTTTAVEEAAAVRPSDEEYSRAMDDVMTETFLQLDHQWTASGRAAHARSSGSCGLVTHVNDERRIITVASVGDCRAVVARRSREHASGVEAMPLSVDQTCKNVVEVDLVRRRCSDPCPVRLSRVDQLAGVDGMLRVAGSLAVTRAFGDMYLKLPQYSMPGLREHVPYITCKPAVTSFAFTPDDEFVVLASDGLWDHFSSQEVVEKVRRIVHKRRTAPAARELNLSSFLIFDCLHNAAVQRGLCLDMLLQMPQASRRQFHDDISIIVIMLNAPRGHIHAGLFMTDTDTESAHTPHEADEADEAVEAVDEEEERESPTAPPPASRSPTRRACALEDRFRKLRKTRKRLRKRMRSLGYERDDAQHGDEDDANDADYEGASLRERQEEHGSGGPLSLLRMLKKKLFHLKNKRRRRAGVSAERRKKRHAAVREKRDTDSESAKQ